MWFSGQNCPINVRNSRKFEFLFFIPRHRAVRQKHFWQKTLPIGSRSWCRRLRAVTFSYAKLELQACEAFPYFAPPKVVKMTLRSSKSRKRMTSGKNVFDKTCSYNLPQHFMFWWPRLNLKSEINISKNVEKRHFYDFRPPPFARELSTRKTLLNKLV